VAAGIVVLAAGVFGTLYFTLQISARLDDQERQLERSNLALRRAHRTMEQLYARRSRFMRTAAHQLKSPFATIETLAGLLRDEAVDAATSKDLVRRIIGRCRMGVEVVSELLTLARVEETARAAASGAPARCAAIGSVVRRLNERFAVQAKARGIALGVSCEACAEDQVTVDERDLEDCLGNLLDNALKYTGEGGRAELQVERQGPDIVISVTDTGMGIAGKNLEEIFEPFCRGPQALAAGIPGTGLGLTIVREIVERAGGRIEVRSKVGEGSRFTVRLPRLGQTAACQKAAEAGQPGAVRIVPEAVAADRQG
jgi:signal transduction histidine kinase